ncbi:MAG: lysophospholipid acyltransferase family protein [Candidatus Acidoferrales bacterium]
MPETTLPRLMATLRATLTAAVVFLYVLVVGAPVTLYAWLTGRIMPIYRIAQGGIWLGLWLAGIRFDVRGRENIPRDRACVYMSNHQSNIDPPLMFVLLPPRIAFIAKKDVFAVPVLGKAMHLADFVPIDRYDPEAARAAVEEALKHLRPGVSLIVYPEGTRSPDGRLQRFKHGVFVLALRAQAPIVPITVIGAEAIMPKKKWQIYPGRIQVTVHPPVETRGRSLGDRAQLALEVQRIIAAALPPEKQPQPVPAEAASVRDESL